MAQKGQRIDTLLKSEDGQHYAVVDAKYYGAQSPNTAPGWSDLVKQFFYVNAVEEVAGSTVKVTNHFIFPGSKSKLKAAYVAHRNKSISSENDCLSNYPPIHCHYRFCRKVLISGYCTNLQA
ncbi:LlaJI family restriction endonuclease [Vibrio algicola]|nr:LlaJI family restriction endonuclease [Vibrio algicola]